ncbi:MAG: NAD(P)/FAD-dependent oxidoreductase [Actinobacteria bacterium]|nr:MAG: NAD(P)/FAD-dependent oxidoreductase [Actinomycetota bacterium]
MTVGGSNKYDAVIVGARVAGTPAATRLAQAGWKVLLVDREPPPGDTLSTHALFPNTLARLAELGALERIESRHRVNYVEYAIRTLGYEATGSFTPVGGFDRMAVITRPVLDPALLKVAAAAGAETRFGEKVTGLLGAGTDADPVRGVVLGSGEEIEARWVLGADGRVSTVARLLGLEKERQLAGEMAFMFGYWRGLPPTDQFKIDVIEEGSLVWSPAEDDLSILILGVDPLATRGGPAEKQRTFVGLLDQYSDWFDPAWLQRGEQVGGIRVAPETMLRGFFRQGTGPGWALIGDAGHFKNPSTAQGISDAIEQSLHVAAELTGQEESLAGFEAYRDERAREHYEWSFDFARFANPDTAAPIFRGLVADPEAGQNLRDALSRQLRPKEDVFTKERLNRWFSAVPSAR